MPVTQEQWWALHEHVTERIKTDEKFTLYQHDLQKMFGITFPFWDDCSLHGREVERTYTADRGYGDSNGEPIEIVFKRKA